MTRLEFMANLGILIRPSAPEKAAAELAKLLPFLTDFADTAFTEEALGPVAEKLKKRSPNLGEVRAALASWKKVETARTHQRASERSAADVWEDRQAELRAEWSDVATVRRAVSVCEGEDRLLHTLALVLGKYAPHNLGEIPPRILDRIDAERAA
jgi:hypothetical protein